ncbi:50S ribosomal protein L17 [bioreactor metagenome]|uniref:50S ribosomal protein L17 n=1 Tax=bioreactor metagenome TaxID=1076179 RepID=A0A644T5V5_9ZZZZ|nr:50S ribosomal protein L17 [Candidatus Elulimicrobiales bacterium]
MKHHKNFRKFGRERNQRHAFIKGLAINLIRHGKMETTEARAKEIRPFVERLVTLAKVDSVARRRLVSSRIYNQEPETKKLFAEIAPKYKDVNGGYLRITKLGQRIGDGSPIAVIEFV